MGKKVSYLKFYNIILLLFFIFIFAFAGTQCDKVVSGGKENLKPFLGKWRLYKQFGAFCDVCPNEIVQFFYDNSVWNTCPNSAIIASRYNVVIDQLIYVDNGPTYNYTFGTDSLGQRSLELVGVNVSRHLWYVFVSDNENIPILPENNNESQDFINSSVFKKINEN